MHSQALFHALFLHALGLPRPPRSDYEKVDLVCVAASFLGLDITKFELLAGSSEVSGWWRLLDTRLLRLLGHRFRMTLRMCEGYSYDSEELLSWRRLETDEHLFADAVYLVCQFR